MDLAVSRDVDRRKAAAREWDDTVAQVRRLPGFEDFLLPPRMSTLLPATGSGPVAVINVSRWRCDALIVEPAGVRVVELPRLTAQTVAERADAYLTSLGVAERAAREFDTVPAPADDDTLADVLGWLWDDVAGPVLDALGLADTPPAGTPWPRMWWCPTGPLALLPLHAAGHHRAAGGPLTGTPPRTVIDRVVSSYTPTLRVLREAAEARRDGPTDPRMLVVGLPHTPGQPPLRNVAREQAVLRRLLPGSCTFLDDGQATRAAVLDQLPWHSWAHFACHGDQNLQRPSDGGLLLHDGALTVTDLSQQQHQGEFAFLSACKTAVGGVNLPDEAITLTAALHYTGYRHVIGTLWSVLDATAADVAEAVYTALAVDGRLDADRSAYALHDAVHQVRAAGAPMAAWSPFTHTGP
ncbi:CHAT domain-containing protein [Micromonospora sp. LOL_021]|uniref:CHAT domain-containing protein n=1 Tax=Micromonospora sp. LOL_021 TaxID=3345417 RepID=UPI003A84AB18